MSLTSPFLLSPFFFLSFFFYLRKCLSHRAEAFNKVHSLIYCWWNRILSVSLFLFWIHIIPILRKGRRKNSLSCTYLWQGLISRLLSFTGEWHPQNLAERAFLMSSVQRLCSTLFTGDFPGAWLNWRLSLANVCPEVKILFASEGPPGVWL